MEHQDALIEVALSRIDQIIDEYTTKNPYPYMMPDYEPGILRVTADCAEPKNEEDLRLFKVMVMPILENQNTSILRGPGRTLRETENAFLYRMSLTASFAWKLCEVLNAKLLSRAYFNPHGQLIWETGFCDFHVIIVMETDD